MQLISSLRNFIKENPYAFGVFVIATIYLLAGTAHNYPFILHPDEPTTLRTAMAQKFRFGVDRFDWGHLGFYLQYFLYEILTKARVVFDLIGLSGFLKTNFNILYQDPYIFYLVSRISTELMSIVTVIFMYKICRLYFDKKVSTIATLFLAVAPYFLRLSHFAVQDPPQLFFLTLSIFYFLKESFSKSRKNLILSAVLLACSAAYKFNIIFFIPFFYLANFLMETKLIDAFKKFFALENLKRVLLWTAVFLGVFFTIHYTIFTEWDVFWSEKPSYGFIWQIQVNSKSRDDYTLPAMSSLIFEDISKTFSPIAGSFVLIATAYTLFWTIKRIVQKKFTHKDLVLAMLILAEVIFVTLIIKSVKYREHYLFPIYPFLVLAIAYFIENFKLLKKWQYLYLLILIQPIYLSTIQAIEMSRRSTTSLAAEEILQDENRGHYFYDSSDIHNIKLYNHIDDLKSIGKKKELTTPGDVLVTDKVIENEKYELIKVLDNNLRLGNTYYYYKVK